MQVAYLARLVSHAKQQFGPNYTLDGPETHTTSVLDHTVHLVPVLHSRNLQTVPLRL